jgi:hypothetical protein
MTDPASIAAAVASIKAAADIVRMVYDSGQSLAHAELKVKLAEIATALADARLDLAGVQEVLAERDRRIKELEEAFEIKDALIQWHDAYYSIGADGKPAGDPYCLRCWEVEHKRYHLHCEARDRRVNVCSNCNKRYDAHLTRVLSTGDA